LKSYIIIFFGLVEFHTKQIIYTEQIKMIHVYMQKDDMDS
jgi:hypothetical protein